MNIGMISLFLPSKDKGGAGYQAHYMANAMIRAGHAVTMFSPAPRPDDALYSHTQVPVGESLRTFRFAWNLRKIEWTKFDVVHAHGDDYWLWLRKGPAHVRTMHGSCLAETLHVPGLKEKARMLLLGLSEVAATLVADRTVCVSQNTTKYYPWVKRVIMNGVDTSAFRPGPKKEEDPTILFVGTYQNRKRGKMLMDAFAATIRPALPNAKLWMVCEDAPRESGVEVLGRLTTPELADRYARAWVFCLPSSYEGFGVPYIEAMSAATPVVATPNVGAREVLGEGKFGVLAEPAELGQSLLKMLQSPADREQWAAIGLERSREFAWDVIVRKYESVYEEILSKRTASRRAVEAS